jgi:hypothetical protein
MDDQKRRCFIRLFESVGSVYQKYDSDPLWKNRYPNALNDKVQSLSAFLAGYAFERQGRPPSFSAIASRIVSQQSPFALDPRAAWQKFCGEIGNTGLNPKNNPLAPRGTPFTQKDGKPRNTNGSSAVELAQNLEMPLVRWVLDNLKERTQIVHDELCRISGVGDKIASFFMRDVACQFDTFPSGQKNRCLLQPVDIWIQRAAKLLGDTDGKPAQFIVEQAERERCSPERVNQGMWYFGAEIAGSERSLEKFIREPDEIERKKADLAARIESLQAIVKCLAAVPQSPPRV